jgi:hypothetical protein
VYTTRSLLIGISPADSAQCPCSTIAGGFHSLSCWAMGEGCRDKSRQSTVRCSAIELLPPSLMEAGGIRTRNPRVKGEVTPAAASAALDASCAAPASVQDKNRQGALPLRAPPVASHRSGPRSNPTCSPGRSKPCEMHRETKGGKGPHLRTLAGALPLLSGKRWKGETKYPYPAASRRAIQVYVCEASRQALARIREKTKYPCLQPRGHARIIARSPA